jgi:hypothetical protein
MHEFSGWMIFVVATVLFLGLHSLTIKVRKKLGWLPKQDGDLAKAKVSQ